MALLLMGCNGGKPDDVSQEMYDVAVYAIKAADLYLNAESTSEEVYEKIDSLNIPETDAGSKDFLVDSSILRLKISILGADIGSQNLTDVKEARNELAERINYKD